LEKSPDLKILFLVLAGGGPEHIRDEITQRNTWANQDNQKYSVVWLRAGKQLEFDQKSRNLYLPCGEGELLKKSVLAIDWALDKLHFDVIVRTNVSTYFAIDSLSNHLETYHFDSNSFGGHLHYKKTFAKISELEYFISGTGIFLGKHSSNILRQIPLLQFESIPDDIAITEYLSSFPDLQLLTIPRLTLSNHHFFFPSFFIRCKSSWNDTLASKRMYLLDEFFRSEGFLRKSKFYFDIYWLELKNCRFSLIAPFRYLNRVRVELKEFLLNRRLRNSIFR
jgi:hypothetical protein